jgi:hypothetical protein
VLLGMPGSGKTALLEGLGQLWDQVIPVARLDLGAPDQADLPPREIVVQLAFQLAKHRPQFGRMPFRLLMLCLLIAGADINPKNRDRALDDVRKAVISDTVRPEREQAINKAVDAFIQTRLVPSWSRMVAGVLLRGAETMLWRQRLRHVSGLWPRRGNTRHAVNPRELLVDLGTGARDVVDEVFCQALLADLRTAYQRGIRAHGRTANCAVLLDNVDSVAGSRFLQVLADCRTEAPGDPLVVFAASRTWLPAWSPLWTMPGATRDGVGRQQVRRPKDASFTDWTDRVAGTASDSWRYLVELPHLTAQEVVDLDAAGTHPVGSRPARFVHRLTTGHPMAVRMVLDRFGGPATTAAMRGVLDTEHSAGGATDSMARTIMHRLLGDQDEVDEDAWATLTGFAVADDFEVGAQLAGRAGDQEAKGKADVLRTLRTRLLVTTRDGRPALDPWLRRLVLHELAKHLEDPGNWWATHTRHRNFHSAKGNRIRALYHGLAIGEIQAVIDHLAGRLGELKSEEDARLWIGQLNTITSAPNRLTVDRTPADQVEQLVSGLDNVTLARLVVAKWLLSDPLADPEESLRASVRRGLERLADDTPPGYLVFIDEADKYIEGPN